MKSDQSLGDLQNMKFSKKKRNSSQLSKRIRIFLVNFPMRPELVFLSTFVY